MNPESSAKLVECEGSRRVPRPPPSWVQRALKRGGTGGRRGNSGNNRKAMKRTTTFTSLSLRTASEGRAFGSPLKGTDWPTRRGSLPHIRYEELGQLERSQPCMWHSYSQKDFYVFGFSKEQGGHFQPFLPLGGANGSPGQFGTRCEITA